MVTISAVEPQPSEGEHAHIARKAIRMMRKIPRGGENLLADINVYAANAAVPRAEIGVIVHEPSAMNSECFVQLRTGF